MKINEIKTVTVGSESKIVNGVAYQYATIELNDGSDFTVTYRNVKGGYSIHEHIKGFIQDNVWGFIKERYENTENYKEFFKNKELMSTLNDALAKSSMVSFG